MDRECPGMTDRAVGPHILIALVDRVVGPGQKKKIAPPTVSDMDQGHIFGGPPV